MESKHTPLPWVLKKGNDNQIRGDNDSIIADDTTYYPTAPDVEDMEFIVKACNSYYEREAALIKAREALQEIKDVLPPTDNDYYVGMFHDQYLVAAEALSHINSVLGE